MVRTIALMLATISVFFPAEAPLRAQGVCSRCELPPGCRGQGDARPRNGRNCQQLEIVVESNLDFGRVVLFGQNGVQVLLDLETGERHVIGQVDSLGGLPITARATIFGAPLESIRVDLPFEVAMRDPTGGEARIRDFVTDLPPAPLLGADGRLSFRFSGTLVIDAEAGASGNLRGRVPISVEYP